jgi:hypothetical protein
MLARVCDQCDGAAPAAAMGRQSSRLRTPPAHAPLARHPAKIHLNYLASLPCVPPPTTLPYTCVLCTCFQLAELPGQWVPGG